jgi:hypothetical protein
MQTDPREIALLLIGGLGPMCLFIGALTSRKCVWAAWAKLAYLLASLAGLAWGIIGFHRFGAVTYDATHPFVAARIQMCMWWYDHWSSAECRDSTAMP